MTPTKMYALLFALVIVAYGAFMIMKSLNKSITEVEHFVEEAPDADYKYRLEVMKVFDLYLNRNPTAEEIGKYAILRNEQDILLAILKDFNISASDIDASKLAKYNSKDEKKSGAKVGVEEEFKEDDLVKMTDAIIDNAAAATTASSTNSEGLGNAVMPHVEKDEHNQSSMATESKEEDDAVVSIPKSKLKEIKEHLKTIYEYFATLE